MFWARTSSSIRPSRGRHSVPRSWARLAAGKRAGGFSSVRSAVRTIGGVRKDVNGRGGTLIAPDRQRTKLYDPLYVRYREAAAFVQQQRAVT